MFCALLSHMNAYDVPEGPRVVLPLPTGMGGRFRGTSEGPLYPPPGYEFAVLFAARSLTSVTYEMFHRMAVDFTRKWATYTEKCSTYWKRKDVYCSREYDVRIDFVDCSLPRRPVFGIFSVGVFKIHVSNIPFISTTWHLPRVYISFSKGRSDLVSKLEMLVTDKSMEIELIRTPRDMFSSEYVDPPGSEIPDLFKAYAARLGFPCRPTPRRRKRKDCPE